MQIELTLMSRKQAFGLARMIEHFVQRVGALFAAEHRKKNPLLKMGSMNPAASPVSNQRSPYKRRASIGEIRFDINLRDASRVCHSFCNGWLFRQRFLEKIFSTELGFPKSFTVENHSDTCSLSW